MWRTTNVLKMFLSVVFGHMTRSDAALMHLKGPPYSSPCLLLFHYTNTSQALESAGWTPLSFCRRMQDSPGFGGWTREHFPFHAWKKAHDYCIRYVRGSISFLQINHISVCMVRCGWDASTAKQSGLGTNCVFFWQLTICRIRGSRWGPQGDMLTPAHFFLFLFEWALYCAGIDSKNRY